MNLTKFKSPNLTQFIITYLLFFAIVIFPLWYMEFIPLIDYPNHLARMHIIANIDHNSYLKEYYQVSWNIVPNLAIDLFIPPLVKIFGVNIAGKVTLSFMFFLITSGTIALNFVLFKRLSFLPFASFIILYNSTLSFGFISFNFMLGVCLWFITIWILLKNQSIKIRLFVFSIISTILFIGHAYAIGVSALVVIGHELYCSWKNKQYNLSDLKPTFIVTLGQFLIPVSLYLMSPTSGGSSSLKNLKYASILTKFGVQYWGSLGDYYNLLLSRLTFVIVLIIPIIGICLGIIHISKEMRIGILLLFISYLCLPKQLLTSSHADWRLLIPFSLVFVSSISFTDKANLISRWIFTSLFLIFLCLRIYVVWETWNTRQPEYQDMMTAIAKIDEGSKFFALRAYEKEGEYNYGNQLPFGHVPCYAVILKSAFVPTLFASEKQQPLSYTTDYQNLSKNAKPQFYPYGNGVNWDQIFENYDFVLISHLELFEQSIPMESLELIYQSSFNSLYKIK